MSSSREWRSSSRASPLDPAFPSLFYVCLLCHFGLCHFAMSPSHFAPLLLRCFEASSPSGVLRGAPHSFPSNYMGIGARTVSGPPETLWTPIPIAGRPHFGQSEASRLWGLASKRFPGVRKPLFHQNRDFAVRSSLKNGHCFHQNRDFAVRSSINNGDQIPIVNALKNTTFSTKMETLQ